MSTLLYVTRTGSEVHQREDVCRNCGGPMFEVRTDLRFPKAVGMFAFIGSPVVPLPCKACGANNARKVEIEQVTRRKEGEARAVPRTTPRSDWDDDPIGSDVRSLVDEVYPPAGRLV